jgi:hypothetical protein
MGGDNKTRVVIPVDEQRVREIIREEIAAIEGVKVRDGKASVEHFAGAAWYDA